MKLDLITFDRTTLPHINNRQPYIYFNKQGSCTLSSAACQFTQYEAGDEIAIHQDSKKPGDWYLSLTAPGDGIGLRNNSRGKGNLVFNCLSMAATILNSLDIKEASASFVISDEPVIMDSVYYWPILTANPIIKTKK